jgi:glutamine amidotransferase
MDLKIIDLGYGNKLSLESALRKSEIPFLWASAPSDKEDHFAGAYLLPGVGSAASALLAMRQLGWFEILQKSTRPILGICLGYQLLFESVEEGAIAGTTLDGLGLLAGHIENLPAVLKENSRRRPHIGWNEVFFRPTENALPLLDNLKGHFYFAHSYAPLNSADAVGFTDDFIAVAQSKNVIGFQFHPEISGPQGVLLFKEFWSWCKSFPPSI